MSDTIAAISTPLAPAGLGVIRISGPDALQATGRVFRCAGNRTLDQLAGYTAAYGHMADAGGEIDDGVALVFRAPHSYTGEDTVELSCHGGVEILKQVLRALLESGCRPAGPGEFTKRAFLNGKLSLTQAEAVMDSIRADGEAALRSANIVRRGGVYKEISGYKEQLVQAAAMLAAYIDFPEEGLDELDGGDCLKLLDNVKNGLGTLIGRYDAGAVLRNGIDCVIAGKPNVGKSTIMNLLAGCERSIVTDEAGTTRDVVEQTVSLDGITLRLSDTAGIRDAGSRAEQLGVQRALAHMGAAQLVLAVIDGSRPLDDDDRKMLEHLGDTPRIVVVNKTDLQPDPDLTLIGAYGKPVCICAKTGEGGDRLRQAILAACGAGRLDPDAVCLSNERQLHAARQAYNVVCAAVADCAAGQTWDAVGVLIEDAIGHLLELTGESVSETVVNRVFEQFCVGK